MDVFVYFPAAETVSRDVIEDELQELLGESGEVAGGGGGETGSNLDIEIFEEDPSVVSQIRALLRRLGVSSETYLVVNGERVEL